MRYGSDVRVLGGIRRLIGRRGSDDTSSDRVRSRRFRRATEELTELRGDRISALPPDHATSATENVAAAAKDYGLSRFSGETDALGSAADGYRSSRKRRRGRRRR